MKIYKRKKAKRVKITTKKRTIWVGQIPDVFGYGVMVAETTEKACMAALKKAHDSWPDRENSFEKNFDYWGGRVEEIELGKKYFDNFGE